VYRGNELPGKTMDEDFLPVKTIARALFVLLALLAVMDGVGVYFYNQRYELLMSVWNGEKPSEHELLTSDHRIQAIGIAIMVVHLAVMALLSFWTYRVVHNAQLVDDGAITITPGAAAGSFFVPVYQLWTPFRVLRIAYVVFVKTTGQRKGYLVYYLWWLSWVLFAAALSFLGRLMLLADELRDLIRNAIILTQISAYAIYLELLTVVVVMLVTRACVRCLEDPPIQDLPPQPGEFTW
jgi:hypothetical protein